MGWGDHVACNWQAKINLVQREIEISENGSPLDLLVWRLMRWDLPGVCAAEQLPSAILILFSGTSEPAVEEPDIPLSSA